MNIRLSIITVCYNSENTIKKTLESVLAQSTKDFEYLIIDGGSTDNTYCIILDYVDKFKAEGMHIVTISEKDRGIYDAMNKGIERSSAEWVYFLNSGDILSDKQVVRDFNCLVIDNKIGLIYSDIVFEDNKQLHRNKYNINGDNYFIMNTICHQAMFIRRKIYEMFEGFSLDYKIVSDKKLLLQIIFDTKYNLYHWERYAAVYNLEGFSALNQKLSINENYSLVQKYYPKSLVIVSYINFLIKRSLVVGLKILKSFMRKSNI